MSKRPDECPEGHAILWIIDDFGICTDHNWFWDPHWTPEGRLRRVYPTTMTESLISAFTQEHKSRLNLQNRIEALEALVREKWLDDESSKPYCKECYYRLPEHEAGCRVGLALGPGNHS